MPLKVSFHMSKGFTLIEILISLVILSVILLVTSNILESSLETERNLSNRLEESSSLNLSSIIVKRDIRQIINVPLRDYYGEFLQATIIGDDVQKKISFNSKVNSLSNDSSPQLGGDLDANSNDILMGDQSVKFGTSKWEIVLDGTDLDFKYNGTTVFKLASNGAVTSANNITAFGSP